VKVKFPPSVFLPSQYYLKRNRWYLTLLITAGAGVGAGFSPDELWAVPFPVIRKSRWDCIGISAWAEGPDIELRLGIYDDDGDCYPDNLLLETAALTSLPFEEAIDITLVKGLYHLAVLGRYDFNATNYPIQSINILGAASSGNPIYPSSYVAIQGYGPLPDPFPAGADMGDDKPAIMLRLLNFS